MLCERHNWSGFYPRTLNNETMRLAVRVLAKYDHLRIRVSASLMYRQC